MTAQQSLPTNQAHVAREKNLKKGTLKLSQQVMTPAIGQRAVCRGAAALLPFSTAFFT